MSELAAAMNVSRLWSRLMQLGELGSTGGGGVNRQAMSTMDAEAHILVATWAQQFGADVSVDDFGNMIVNLPNVEDCSPILVGSHLDTQPTGGRFDGAYGVIAGLEVLETLKETNCLLTRPVKLIVWNNEEGCRFTPSTMGSSLATGRLLLGDVLTAVDSDGVTLAKALAQFHEVLGSYPRRSRKITGFMYVEAHIEQGPILENNGKPVAAVTGVQGIRQYRVIARGVAAHAGTTPESMRKDAFVAALRIIGCLRDLMADGDVRFRFTVGSMKIEPNSINTVPHTCSFTIDLRHPDEDALNRFETKIFEQVAAAKQAHVIPLLKSPAISFDGEVIKTIEECAQELGFACDRMPSGATHDAKLIAEMLPAGMIFIPCRGGLSHTPEEWADPEHTAAGARLLASVVARIGSVANCCPHT